MSKDLLAGWLSFSSDVTPVKAIPWTILEFSHVHLPRLPNNQPLCQSIDILREHIMPCTGTAGSLPANPISLPGALLFPEIPEPRPQIPVLRPQIPGVPRSQIDLKLRLRWETSCSKCCRWGDCEFCNVLGVYRRCLSVFARIASKHIPWFCTWVNLVFLCKSWFVFVFCMNNRYPKAAPSFWFGANYFVQRSFLGEISSFHNRGRKPFSTLQPSQEICWTMRGKRNSRCTARFMAENVNRTKESK